jgi:ribonuclease HI
MLHIFTDGACPNNGKGAARASYAVVFWNLPDATEPHGLAELVPLSEPQTNQRAELRGLARAFEEIQSRRLKGTITIWTDSEYARKCVMEWGPQWKVRGWRRAQNAKKPLEHLDLLKPMIEFYEQSQHFLIIKHIAAHTKHKEFPYCGNTMADSLATAAVFEHLSGQHCIGSEYTGNKEADRL